MKAVVIGDPLVASETLIAAVKQLIIADEIETVVPFTWHESLTKEEFQAQIQLIEQQGPEGLPLPDGLLEELVDADYLFCHYAPVSQAMISAGQALTLVGTCRGGLENVNLDGLRAQDIQLIHVIRNAEPVAEFTLGLMLAETRNIVRAHQGVVAGQWPKEFANDLSKTVLTHQIVGIIGAGYIGKLLIKKLNALGVKVLVYDPYVSQADLERANLICQSVSLDYLCQKAEIISLHMRVSPETTGLINHQTLALMSKKTYLINTARAELIDEDAFYDALKNKKIAGAALDVLWQEPLEQGHPLTLLDNLTLTSHIAGDTYDAIPGSPFLLVNVINEYLETGHSPMLVN